MNTRRITTNAILIAAGAILHQITPPLGGMQADLSLIMLFIVMIYNKDYKTTAICGLIVGIFAALTTKTPGGQIPNIMDKFITCNIMYFALIPLRNKLSLNKQISIMLPIGTALSGAIFLTVLMVISGLPAGMSFGTLFAVVVIPTAVINLIVGIIVFNIVQRIVGTKGTYAVGR